MEAVETRSGRAQPLLFTSETYPEIGREAAWCDFLTPLGFRPLRAHDDGFYANASALYSPLDIALTRIAAAPHGLSAVPNKTAAPLILLHVDGAAALRTAATETALKPGDVVVLPRSSDAELVYESPFRALAISVPRDAFGARHVVAETTRARVADNHGLGRVLSAMLTSIAATMDTLSSCDLSTIDLALAELLLAEFENGAAQPGGETGTSATQAALRRRLCQAIESRLGDPDLTLVQITQIVGISERYAQKLFENMGENFTHYVRDRRLLRSRRELGSPRHANVSVSEIGYRCGFNDAAHFSRVFKERFGASPREYRLRTIEQVAVDASRIRQRGRPQVVGRKGPAKGALGLPGSDAAGLTDGLEARQREIGLDPTIGRARAGPAGIGPQASVAPSHHDLPARADTVHWGYFSRSLPPVLTIASGDIVTIETLSQHASDDPARMIEGDPGAEDVFRWTSETKSVDRRGAGPLDASIFGRGAGEGFGVHVCTGPIQVASAVPGDVLEVRILDIAPRRSGNPLYAGRIFGSNVAAWWGYHYGEFLTGLKPREVVTIYEIFPDAEPAFAGALYNYRWTPQTDPYGTVHVTYDYPGVCVDPTAMKRNHDVLSGIKVPMRLHFGVIGVAPRETRLVDSIPPSYFGGNLDNWRLGKGATVYLPVAVPGALLSVGDPHAAQGDGELCGTAIECSLTGVFQIVLHKRKDQAGSAFVDLDHPLIETPTEWILPGFSHPNYLAAFGEASQSEVYSNSSLDLAMKDAFRKMRRFLMTTRDLSEDEAVSLMAVAVDFGVTQVVDGNWGVHAILKKSVFGTAPPRMGAPAV